MNPDVALQWMAVGGLSLSVLMLGLAVVLPSFRPGLLPVLVWLLGATCVLILVIRHLIWRY